MPSETTNWPRLYSLAALIGAGFGLLLSVGALPSAPDWPASWGVQPGSALVTIVVPVICGAAVGLLLAAAAHLGLLWQRRRSRSGG
jgi:hypothetical protein